MRGRVAKAVAAIGGGCGGEGVVEVGDIGGWGMGAEEEGLGVVDGAVEAAGGDEGGERTEGGRGSGGGGEVAAARESRHQTFGRYSLLPMVSSGGRWGFEAGFCTFAAHTEEEY